MLVSVIVLAQVIVKAKCILRSLPMLANCSLPRHRSLTLAKLASWCIDSNSSWCSCTDKLACAHSRANLLLFFVRYKKKKDVLVAWREMTKKAILDKRRASELDEMERDGIITAWTSFEVAAAAPPPTEDLSKFGAGGEVIPYPCIPPAGSHGNHLSFEMCDSESPASSSVYSYSFDSFDSDDICEARNDIAPLSRK